MSDNLLARLEKADPGTWGRYDQWSQHENIYDEKALEYILQGELQEAITSRGWLWTLSAEDKGHPTGAPYTCHLWDGDINEMVMDISGGSPTAALLEAYLSAIEGQA